MNWRVKALWNLAEAFGVIRTVRDQTYPKDPNPEHWKTINGSHVHMDKNGNYDGGAGGKFNGRHHYGPNWRQKAALMNRLTAALHKGIKPQNVVPKATNQGNNGGKSRNGAIINTGKGQNPKPREPSSMGEWATELKKYGADVNFSKINDKVGMANAKEIYEVISENPKIANFINKYGVIVDAKPLGGAHGVTSCYLNPTFGKIRITLDQKSHDSIEAAEKRADLYEKSGFKMPCDKAHAPHYTESHELGHMIEAIVCYERLKNATWVTSKEFKQETNKIKREIIKCAKDIDPNTNFRNYKQYLSDYGKTNPREFFAECYANYRCGKANILGKAIGLWIERWNKNV